MSGQKSICYGMYFFENNGRHLNMVISNISNFNFQSEWYVFVIKLVNLLSKFKLE